MNADQVISQLKKKYSGKTIISLPEKNPTEILCEVESTLDHPEYSLAIAVVDKSTPHVHLKTTETYKGIHGSLILYIDDKPFSLKQGDDHTIKLGQTHWAEGDQTWVECYSKPGWTLEDHIITTSDQLK